MESKDSSKRSNKDIEDELLDLSPDMFDDEMDVDVEHAESSSKKPKLDKSSTVNWCGVSMFEIYKSLSPWSAPEFPLVCPSSVHAVLYHISKTSGTSISETPPVPQRGKDVWDKDHVRMPCSPASLYTTESTSEGQPVLKKRWEVIKEALSQNITNSNELHDAILKYNSRYRNSWKFNGLHKLFNVYLDEEESQWFFNTTLPAMTKLALRLPDLVQSPIPLLRQNHNRSISLSQEQVSCLLANAFFCTFPRRIAIKGISEYKNYPDINFHRLFHGTSKSVLEKLKCICNYFRRVCKNVPCGVMTFSRRTIIPTSCPEWQKCAHLIGSVPLHITSEGTIEDNGVGLLQVDFANKFLGGGVLNYGCVQEEIRFVICPELLVSMLFTECLRPTESLLMIGCERYSDYTGYADTFQWSGSHEDTTPFDASGRRRCAVVAIDALHYSSSKHQYKPELITRELNKAWVGFSHYSADTSPSGDMTLPGVATGNWGCGAFRGSPHLKALIQLMSCCLARRPMVYYTFGNEQLRHDLNNMYNFLCRENVTVGNLYKSLCQFHKSSASEGQLYEFLLQIHNDKIKSTPQASALGKSSPANTTAKSSTSTEMTPKKDSPKISNVEEQAINQPPNHPSEGLPENKERSSSSFVMTDVEKGLNTKEKSVKVSNCQLFDQVLHLDETSNSKSTSSSSASNKKHGSFSFFEPKYENVDNVQLASENSSESQTQQESESSNSSDTLIGREKRKNLSKIPDYFQRIPKKGS